MKGSISHNLPAAFESPSLEYSCVSVVHCSIEIHDSGHMMHTPSNADKQGGNIVSTIDSDCLSTLGTYILTFHFRVGVFV